MGVEIRLQGTAIPCIAETDIKAGLAVKLVASVNAPAVLSGSADPDPAFRDGIYNILQGADLPVSDNDTLAKYVAAFRVYNEKPPLYESLPNQDIGTSTVPYTLRGFIEGTANLPAENVTIRMTPPRLADDATIPSGALMLAYDEGIYTVTSGCYYGALSSFTIGSAVSVKGGTGKWYQGTGGTVATVFEKNTTKGTLTIKTG